MVRLSPRRGNYPGQRVLTFTSLVTRGEESLFDGRRIRRGVHVRWTYSKRLGPANQFELMRSTNQQAPEWSIRLPAPVVEAEVWERVRADLGAAPSGDRDRYRAAATQLAGLVRHGMSALRPDLPFDAIAVPGSTGGPSHSRLSIADALVLSSLDPYVARMQGVYAIDGIDPAPLAGRRLFYRLRGDYGAREWPPGYIDFTRLRPMELQPVLQFDGVELAMRQFSVPADDDIYGPHLVATGGVGRPLEAAFETPVLEVVLRVTMSGRGEHRALTDLRAATVTAAGDRLTIRADDGAPFRQLWLFGLSGPWHLFELWHRERVGPVGVLDTGWVGLEMPSARTPLPLAVVTGLAQTAVPATLDATGEVPQSSSQVEVSANVPALPDDPYRAVRMKVGRSKAGHHGAPELVLAERNGAPRITALHLPAAEPVVPELVSAWPLEGHVRDLKSGALGALTGPHAYVVDRPDGETAQPVLALATGGFATVSHDRRAQHMGQQLTLQVRVKPDPDQETPTLIGNDWRDSFWLGLRRRSDGSYLPRLWLNRPVGTARDALEGTRAIPAGRWSSVTVSYDGAHVRFYVDGELDIARPCAVGAIRVNPRGQLCIGADSGSTASAQRYPFSGRLADVRIWQQVLAPDDADDRWALAQHALGNRIQLADLIYALPGITAFATDSPVIPRRDAALQSLGEQFTLELWVKPAPGQTDPTLVGNGWRDSYWLGLHRRADGSYLPRLWLNRRASGLTSAFHGRTPLPASRWTHLAVSYDGAAIRFYKDGVEDARHAAVLGPVVPHPAPGLIIGADAGSTVDRRSYPYVGELADVRIWQVMLTPDQLRARIGAPQLIDRPVADGSYAYQVQGIDLFGRAGEWSSAVGIDVRDELVPPPPIDLRAKLVPLRGSVVALDRGASVVHLPGLSAALEARAVDALARVVGHDLVVSRALPTGDTASQPFEVRGVTRIEGEPDRYRLELQGPPFVELDPAPGDRAVLQLELELIVGWAWSGLQRLFYPRARGFRVHRERGPLHALRGEVATVTPAASDGTFRVATTLRYDGPAGGLRGGACQLGGSIYEITGHTTGAALRLDVAYRARPVVTPRPGDLVALSLPALALGGRDHRRAEHWTGEPRVVPLRAEPAWQVAGDAVLAANPITADERDPLVAAGVSWLPANQVYVLASDRFALPTDYADPDARGYVPGALVAFDQTTAPGSWQAFNVLWHQRRGERLEVFLQYNDPERDRHAPLPPRTLRSVRYLPGQRYHLRDWVASPLAPGEPTAEWAVGLCTADDRGAQGAVGQIASAVAVDRRRPPVPRAPRIVAIDRADVHGKSRVALAWDAPASDPGGLHYQVYRALDSAVFTRDLEQRRLRTGAYAGRDRRAILIDDDRQFDAWIRCYAHRIGRHELAAGWQDELFVARPAGVRPRGGSAGWTAWDAATPTWRAWADRFYPALTEAQIVLLAGRAGNDASFALVHERPLRAREHSDVVDGATSDRYLYRLRTLSAALLGSTEMGPPSEPRRPPIVKPATAPVVSRIDAGDQEVVVRWSINREPDLVEYRVYRADAAAALDDLRFWGESYRDDARWVATIADPRIRAQARAVALSGASAVEEVLGVYRADEFDFAASPPSAQPGALDHRDGSTTIRRVGADTLHIEGLTPIADGTAVAIVYRDAAGAEHVLAQIGEASHRDRGLEGLVDYYYRVVAVRHDERGAPLVSAGSATVKARPLALSPPAVPEFRHARSAAEPEIDEIALWTDDVLTRCEVLIKRRELTGQFWRTVVDWTPLERGHRFTDRIPRSESSAYAVSIRTRAGILCATPRLLFSAGRAGE